MERRTIRKVPVEAPPDVWLRVRVRPDRINFTTLFGDFSLPFAALVRWCGMASMVGGVLWIIVFLLLQIDSYALSFYEFSNLDSEIAWVIGGFIRHLFRFLDEKVQVHAIALALMLLGLVGMFIRYRKTPSLLGTIGFLISFLGLVIGIRFTLTYSEQGLVNYFIFPPLSVSWYNKAQPGHLILCIGLLLFGIALIRSKTLPARAVVLLIVSTLFMQVLALFWGFYMDLEAATYYVGEWLIQVGVFAGLAVLFGVSWVWIGRVLWSENPKSVWKT